MRHYLLSTVLICAASLAQAQDTALIVGISDYDNLRDIRGADDVTDAGRALDDLGFRVYGTASEGPLQAQGNAFAGLTEDADRLVVVLAGQFITDGTRTWLLPADALDPAPFSVAEGALSVETALRQLGDAPGAAVLVLGYDDRRDTDFGNGLRSGIGTLDIPSGVTVVRGDVSAATDLLEDVIAVPGGDVIAAISKDRDLTGSGFMPSRLVLVPADTTRPAGPPTTAPQVVITTPTRDDAELAARLEESLWQEARASDTQQSYTRYLDRYPNGSHTDAAVARLRELRDPNLAQKQVEDALNLPLEARRAIQRDLQVLGYDTRGIDGIFGPGSRGAIKEWQTKNNVTANGFLTANQITLIDQQAATRSAQIEAEAQQRRAEAVQADRAYWAQTGATGAYKDLRTYLERYPDGEFAEQAETRMNELLEQERAAANSGDRQVWDRAATANSIPGYRQYLKVHPDGRFADEAQTRISQLQQAGETQVTDEAAIRAENALSLDPISLRLVESRLAQLGLEPGEVDGKLDDNSRRAIRRYQQDRNLTDSGYLDQSTVSQMLTDAFR